MDSSEMTRESAQAAVARWNVLLALEDNPAYRRVVAECRAQQVVLSQEIALLDETMLATGADVQAVAMSVVFKHAKWLGLHLAANFLVDAKRDNQEAIRFLDSLKAQEKER